MRLFIATLMDETGGRFIAETEAANREEAAEYFRDDYPESRLLLVQTEDDLIAEDKAAESRFRQLFDLDSTDY